MKSLVVTRGIMSECFDFRVGQSEGNRCGTAKHDGPQVLRNRRGCLLLYLSCLVIVLLEVQLCPSHHSLFLSVSRDMNAIVFFSLVFSLS